MSFLVNPRKTAAECHQMFRYFKALIDFSVPAIKILTAPFSCLLVIAGLLLASCGPCVLPFSISLPWTRILHQSRTEWLYEYVSELVKTSSAAQGWTYTRRL